MAYSVPSPVEPQLIVASHPTPTRVPRSGSVVTVRPPATGGQLTLIAWAARRSSGRPSALRYPRRDIGAHRELLRGRA